MRYIGNKTKLLKFIGSVVDELAVGKGRAIDPFAGTASAGRFLKKEGYEVHSSDIMAYSYVLQRAYVELDHLPTFEGLINGEPELIGVAARADFHAALRSRFGWQQDLFSNSGGVDREADTLRRVLIYLDSFLSPFSSFVTREYCSAEADADSGKRMFFTEANGRRIDAIRHKLHDWRSEGLLTENEFFLLLSCLLEAADSVANTTGVYAAYVKSWQSNAVKPLRLCEPALVVNTGLACTANQQDANKFVRQIGSVELTYLDPPYNTRQYSSYYHVPEVIAEGWFDGEPLLRGKTGLIPDMHKKSDWSVKATCEAALRDLIAHLDSNFVLLSYNSEGIIPEEAVEEIFSEYGVPGTFRKFAVDYSRYRSDSDHEQRVYKADEVTEYLFAVQLSSSTVADRTRV